MSRGAGVAAPKISSSRTMHLLTRVQAGQFWEALKGRPGQGDAGLVGLVQDFGPDKEEGRGAILSEVCDFRLGKALAGEVITGSADQDVGLGLDGPRPWLESHRSTSAADWSGICSMGTCPTFG